MVDEGTTSVLTGYRLSARQLRLAALAAAGRGPRSALLVLETEADFPLEGWREAIEAVASRHEILRSRFELPRPGQAGAMILEPRATVSWSSAPAPAAGIEGAAGIEDWLDAFEPRWEPASRAHLGVAVVSLGSQRGDRLWLVLHAPAWVADTVSLWQILSESLVRLEGRDLDEPPLQYGQFAEWQATETERSSALERRELAERLVAAQGEAVPFFWPNGERRLSTLAVAAESFTGEGEAPEHELAAAAVATLAAWLGRERLHLGVTAPGRLAGELAGVVGPFERSLPVALDLVPELPPSALAAPLRAAAAAAEQRFGLLEPEGATVAALSTSVLVLPDELGEGRARLRVREARGAGEVGALHFEVVRLGTRCRLRLWFDAGQLRERDGRRLLDSVVASAPAPPAEAFAKARRDLVPGAAASVVAELRRMSSGQPDAIAVIDREETLSYGELQRRVDDLAAMFQARGVGPEKVVAVGLENRREQVVVMLGVLAAGGAYLPLEAGASGERLRFQLEDARVPLIVTEGTTYDSESSVPTLRLSRPLAARPVTVPTARPLPDPDPDALAYLIYTSGSTGTPKGVAVPHGSLARSTAVRDLVYGAPPRRFLLGSPLFFDSSVAGLYWTLTRGGTLVFPEADETKDPALLLLVLERQRITHWLGIPSLYRWLLELASAGALRSLEVAMVAGEACPREIVPVHAANLPGCRLVNEYGPTEVTVWSVAGELNDLPAPGSVPIGDPIPGVTAALLDTQGAAVAPGRPGELYLGGSTLARGYLGRPGWTAERFLPDPESARPGGRRYRTGDLARRLPDGRLVFLGRCDEQVKVRGHRIELGDVEAGLSAFPGVREAAVIARSGAQGVVELVAFLAATPPPSPAAVRAALLVRLPEAAVPAEIRVLEQLPRTSRGKIDRDVLTELAGRPEPSSNAAVASLGRTAVEEIVLGAFSEVFARGVVGPEDDFLSLGGHSLLAIPILSRLRRAFALELPLDQLFRTPRLADLAEEIEARLRRRGGEPGVLPAPPRRRLGDDPAPLSFAQRRLWFLDQLEGPSPLYNCPAVLEMIGSPNGAALRGAIDEIVRRHEPLRTSFPSFDGAPVQQVHVAGRMPIGVVDLGALAGSAGALAGSSAVVAQLLAAHEARRPFDLSLGPLWRLVWLRLAPRRHRLVLNLHHAICDAVSLNLLVAELASLYRALVGLVADPLPPLPIRYQDWADWQQQRVEGGALEASLEFWRRELGAGPFRLELPTDRPRLSLASHRGAHQRARLGGAVLSVLRALARSRGVTLFVLLFSAWQLLLARLAGASRVLVGVPFAGREGVETEPLIGLFVQTVVLAGELGDDPSLFTHLGRVQQSYFRAHAHQEVPFELLVSRLDLDRELSLPPVFQVMFDFEARPVGRFVLPELELELMPLETGCSRLDLTLFAVDGGDAIDWTLEYNTDLFDATTAERLTGALFTLLEDLSPEALELPCSRLSWLRPAERRQLVAEWGSGPPAHGTGLTLPAIWRQQVGRSSEAIAVVFEDQQWSYAALDAWSMRLAARLRRLGAGPETVIAISGERSSELMAGLLAIVGSGAAYLPVEADEPLPRRQEKLTTARALAWVAPLRCRGDHPEIAALALPWVDSDEPPLAAVDEDLVATELDPDHPAYLLFTSGSTGRPKGVLVPYRGVVNRLLWMADELRLDAGDRYLQKTPVGFDVSVWELFLPLLTGARLVLARPGEHRDTGALRRLLAQQRISIVHFVPSLLQAFLEEPELEALTDLEIVVASGEALLAATAERLLKRTGARLYNFYGPTEASIDVTSWPCRAGWRGPVPLGRPIAGVLALVLDRHLELVPPGVVGELCLGGVVLARGYLGQPGLTAERFRPDPHGGMPGARLYRTGDRVRVGNDGCLDFLGRLDEQIKVRGIRVEPAEIEACLSRRPEVAAAVVVWRPELPGGGGLVAYLSARQGEVADPATLLTWARSELPEAMVPAALVVLAELPLTHSGKIDRRALPAPAGRLPGPETAQVGVPGALAELVAEIWREELGVARLAMEDSFFELGGHSILATRLMARLRRAFELELPLRLLFEHPTVAALTAAIAERLGGIGAVPYVPLAPVEPDPEALAEAFPLTDVQQAYWVGRGEAFDLGQVSAHGYSEIEIEPAALPRFERALGLLITRHGMLRAIFEDARQRILTDVPPWRLEIEDLRELSADDRAARLSARRAELSHEVLPADRWPLFTVRASLLPSAKARLHIGVDGLLADAWSYQVLIGDLLHFFRQPELPLPPLALSFRDYVLAERRVVASELGRRSREYWWQRLPSLPPAPALPLARNPQALVSPRFVRRSHRLAGERWRALKRRGSERGLTSSGLLLACFSEVLGWWSESQAFTLNLTLFNRLPVHPQVQDLVGDFTSTVLLVVEPVAGPFAVRARALQRQLWEALDHRYVSGVEVLRELARRRRSASDAAMPIVFTSTLDLDRPGHEEASVAALGEMVYSITQTPQVWLDHQVFEEAGALAFNWDAVEELFPAGLLDDLFGAYVRLLESLADAAEPWTAEDLNLLPPRQAAICAALNDTTVAVPALRLEQLFAHQAATAPDRPAVIAAECCLSYAELDLASSRLAATLSASGLRPEEPVAVVMVKGWEQPVAVLATLKAGGAYLPVDPGLPPARQRLLLDEAQVRFVLTQESCAPAIPGSAAASLLTVSRSLLEGGPGPLDPSPAVTAGRGPRDLAYILYTSGSTGEPKGVMIEHASVVNRMLDVARRFSLTAEDRALSLTSLSHDLSVFDLFGMWTVGGALVLPAADRTRDPAHALNLCRSHGVTVWNSVPALLDLALEAALGEPELAAPGLALRWFLISGDFIPLHLPERARRLAPEARFTSLGGPTETTVWDVSFPVETVAAEWRSIPYGRPLANAEVHVLDELLRPRPLGVAGELYLAGAGLARGYFRDEARTRERFLIHPQSGQRLYASGDWVRQGDDGTLEILGRRDRQVKIAGQRIELGEIEAALLRLHGVRSAAAAVEVRDRGAAPRLLAAVVLAPDCSLSAQEMRQALAETLPDASIPSSLLVLPALPLSANGKLDRAELIRLAAGVKAAAAAAEVEPAPETLSRLTALVRGVVGDAALGADTDLLELGATSIDLIRISNRLAAELGWRPAYDELFRAPTLRALALGYETAVVSSATREASPEAAVTTLLLDPEERAAFVRDEPGLRHELPPLPPIALEAGDGAALYERYQARRTQRRFAAEVVSDSALARFLFVLSRLEIDGEGRRLYPSAGSLYGIQIYLHVRPGRVEGLEAGGYYYHPVEHTLRPLSPGKDLGAEVHSPFINRPVYEQAAFSVFLVADLAAYGPLYGDHGLVFAQLEAGYLGQLLMSEAASQGLGLCPIGNLEEGPLADLLRLGPQHRLVHSLLGGRRADAPAVETAALGVPLSHVQRRLWLLEQVSGPGAAYNIPVAAELKGGLEPSALRSSLDAVVARHDALRSVIDSSGIGAEPTRPLLRELPPGPVPFAMVELTALGPRAALLASLLANGFAAAPFDLERGPLLRAVVLRLASRHHHLVLSSHHFAADGWSMNLLWGELVTHYRARLAGSGPAPALAPAARYADWVVAEQRALARHGSVHRDYWRGRLAGLPPWLELPADRPRPARPAFRGRNLPLRLPADLARALEELARNRRVTLFVVLLAALQVLFHRLTEARDLAIGTAVSRRAERRFENTIGNFSNNLVLRGQPEPEKTFAALLGELRQTVAEAFEHQDLPFEELVSELGLARTSAHHPLFQALLVVHESGGPEVTLPELALSFLPLERGASRLDLTLELRRDPTGFLGMAELDAELFDITTGERLLGQFETLLRGVVRDAEAPLAALPLLTCEQQAELATWNHTMVDLGPPRGLASWALQGLAAAPESIAVAQGGEQWSGQHLFSVAGRIAAQLAAAHGGACHPVVVASERCPEQIAALLGVLLVGAPFCPLEPDMPEERRGAILATLGVCPVLLARWPASREEFSSRPLLEVVGNGTPGPPSEVWETAEFPLAAPAYVLFTSGSTGRPKGAVISHRAIWNRLAWMQRAFPLDTTDRVLQKTSLGFDVSVWECFWPLGVGARLVLASAGSHRDPAALAQVMAEHRVSVCHFVPSLLAAFFEQSADGLDSLRWLIASGEALPATTAAKARQLPGARLFNLYGPTEAAIDVSAWPAEPPGVTVTVPIGLPIANLTLHVVDPRLRLLPVGVPGELLIGGVGVGDGYFSNPRASAECFLPDPFDGIAGARLYRTGDRVRRLAGGELEFLGRFDQQLKIAGLRLEIGEVEAALLRHPRLRQAVVVPSADSRLVAFVEADAPAPDAAELRRHLLRWLPLPALPAAFLWRDELPRTASGKLDRRALAAQLGAIPASSVSAASSQVPRPSANPLAELLALLWTAVLGAGPHGTEDSFFAAGGDSLRGLELVARARRSGLAFTLADLFAHPTPAALAARIVPPSEVERRPLAPFALLTAEEAEELPAGLEDAYPMSLLQQGMLYHLEQEGAERYYHNVDSYRLVRPFALDHCREAWSRVVARHPALRTSFLLEGTGRPLAMVHRRIELPWLAVDLRALPGPAREAVARRHEQRQRELRLNPRRPPLVCLVALALGDDTCQLIVTQHHAVLDGWSLNVLLAELFAELVAVERGEVSPLASAAISPADGVGLELEALSSPALARFWREEVGELRPTRSLASGVTASGPVVEILRPLPAALGPRLESLAVDLGVPVRSLFLAAHLAALGRLTEQDEVLTAVITDTRPELADAQRLLGLFLNALPLRCRLDGCTWGELARQVFTSQCRQLPARYFPAVRLEQLLGRGSLYETSFNFIHFHVAAELADRVGLIREAGGSYLRSGEALGLTVEVDPDPSRGSRLVLQLDSGRHSRRQGEWFVEQVETALERMCLENGAGLVRPEPISAIGTDGASAENRRGPALGELLRSRPEWAERLAMVGGGEELTYSELETRCFTLGEELALRGVSAEETVAVVALRSPHLPVAMLAVLDRGAAYLAIDASYPAARQLELVRAVGARLVLAEGGLAFPWPEDQTLRLDRRSRPTGPRGELPPFPELPLAAAYIGFTSGSSGSPKGVVVTRAGLAAHLEAVVAAFELTGQDRVLQFASPSFDVANEEILATLAAGATLVLPPQGVAPDFEALEELISGQALTMLNLPASYWAEWTGLLTEAGRPPGATLSRVVVGSEAAPVSALAAWQALPGIPIKVTNAYGPTEATIGPLAFAAGPAGELGELPWLPLGRPLGQARAWVVDTTGSPLAAGMAGELVLGGPGVARGYLGRAAETAERFVPDALSGARGQRLYRTGDLARRDEAGWFHFLGRSDRQVKVRGVRVEPDEVAAVLATLSGVVEAVVAARPDELGRPRLVAWLVLAPGAELEAIRSALAARLPAAWWPAAWQVLEQLPRASGGKLDLAALPEPAAPAASPAAYEPPLDPFEEWLAQAFAELLGHSRVGRGEDFFALGGHSLSAMRLSFQIRAAFGVELGLAAVLAQPTIAALASQLAAHLEPDRERVAPPPSLSPDPGRSHEPFPLTAIQQAYWIGRQEGFELAGVAAHGYQELDFPSLDVPALEVALNRLINRHGMLRAVILPEGKQRILPAVPRYVIAVEDLSAAPPAGVEAALRRLRERMSHQRLAVDVWPLFEIRVSLLPAGRARLHLSLDALVADAGSLEILVAELFRLYRDPAAELPALSLSFRDYVLAQHALESSPAFERARAYWLTRLDELPPPPELPLAAGAETVSGHFRRLSGSLETELTERLRRRARAAGVSLSCTLLTAFAEALAAWSKDRRFALNLTLFQRLPLHPEVGKLVGDFTSLTLLEVDLSARRTFAEETRAVATRLWRDLDHREFSGVEVLRELARRHGATSAALMPVVFTSALHLGNARVGEGVGLPPEVAEGFGITQTPQVWLDHQVSEHLGALFYNWDFVAELFPAGLVEDLFVAYQRLLRELAEAPAAWHRPVGSLTPSDQRQHLFPHLELEAAVAATEPAGARLEELVLAQVLRRGDSPAVLAPDRTLSYTQLELESRVLAVELGRLGALAGERVAVIMAKGWEQVVACLAVLRAGAAYVPLDPEWPQDRLSQLLEKVAAAVVLTQERWQGELSWPAGSARLVVSPLAEGDESRADVKELAGLAGSDRDAAYLIFTSGSTGEPKGVVIEHRGAVNTVLDVNQRYGLSAEDRVLSLSALHFDLSVYDLFGVLAAGGAVVLPAAESRRDPAHWAQLARRHGVTVWNTVPALAELLVEHVASRPEDRPERLRLFLLSGDWVPVSLPDRLRGLAPRARVVALGGATEASIWSILFEADEVDPGWPSIPYGKSMRGQQVRVLDDLLEPRPLWVTGEIYIAGSGLAREYWRQPERTAEVFVEHPLTRERLYRTGDLGRLLPDGNIEFLGREDTQVKIHGYRVELGEIEVVLRRLPGVSAGAVVAVGERRGASSLVALFVARESEPTAEEVRAGLAKSLPSYMVPSRCRPLERLPLSANGKVDQRALLELARREVGERAELATPRLEPATELEQQLAELMAAALGGGLDVGSRDSFFELGGDSLAAIRLLASVASRWDASVPLVDFLAEPTVAGLASALARVLASRAPRDAGATAPDVLVPDVASRFEPFPLTELQEAYWVGRRSAVALGRVAPHSYTEIELLELDLKRLETALDRLVERHDMLRAVFDADGRQRVLPTVPPIRIPVLDLAALDPGPREAALLRVRERMSHQVLPADRWPLFELRACHLGAGRMRLQVSIDLLIADAWSIQLALAELGQLYAEPKLVLPALELSFRDWVLAERRSRSDLAYSHHRDYWWRRLDSLPSGPELPRRGGRGRGEERRFERCAGTLPAALWEELRTRAGREGLTPSGLLVAAFAEVLSLWSASPRFTLNLTTFRRSAAHGDLGVMIGDFTATTLLEVESREPSFLERARAVQRQLWADLDHGRVGGVEVLRELRRRRRAQRGVFAPVVFTSTLIEAGGEAKAPAPWRGKTVYGVSQTPQVLLDCQVGEVQLAPGERELEFNWDYRDAAFPPGLIADLFTAFNRLLTRLAALPDFWKEPS